MKSLARLAATSAIALSMGAVAFGQNYTQTNLQANTSGIAEETDPQLVNSWGLSRASGGVWWVSDNATGVATLYNGPGTKQSLRVFIPPSKMTEKTPTGTPTGIISNTSPTDFPVVAGLTADFIFSTLDGTVAAWNPKTGLVPGEGAPSTHAVTVYRGAQGSVYTGLTAASVGSQRFLYLANFGLGKLEVLNSSFQPINPTSISGSNSSEEGIEHPFTDTQLPENFVPFNVATIGNDIVVAYAQSVSGQPLPAAGPGKGFVDVYNSTGELVLRLQHGDFQNVPWGVTLAPDDFGRFSHALLVGNFADSGSTENSGTIAAYDLASGKFLGFLQDPTGKTLVIQGIWSLEPANVAPANLDPDDEPLAQVYFTAGPNGQTAGLFGYLTAVPNQLIQGSDQ